MQGTVNASHAQVSDAAGNLMTLAMGKTSATVRSASGVNSSVDNTHSKSSGTREESGDSYKYHASRDQLMSAYNFDQGNDALDLKRGKDGKFLPASQQSKEALAAFEQYAHEQAFNKELQGNVISEVATFLGDYGTGLLAGAIVNSFAGNPAGKVIKKVDDIKSGTSSPRSGSNPSPYSSSNQNGSKAQQGINNEFHDNLLMKSDNGKYIINPEASKDMLPSTQKYAQDLLDDLNNGGTLESFDKK